MPQYIALLTLDPEGREAMVRDPHSLVNAASSVEEPGVQSLGLYGVLGRFDFVCIIEAPDNESAARYSLVLGTKAGASVETMPALRMGLLGGGEHDRAAEEPEPIRRPVTMTEVPSQSLTTRSRRGNRDS